MALGELKNDKLTVLAVRMKKGDRRAAAALYEELLPKVFGFFFARTGRREIAEDLSQDIFLKLVERIESFDEEKGRFVVWFWQVARNMLIDHYRGKRETAFSAFEENDLEALATTGPANIDHRLRYTAVKDFLGTLGEDERELFELRYAAEMSYKEIAAILGRTEGALRVASLRLKEKMKKEFKHEI